jgi:hypothetical protein
MGFMKSLGFSPESMGLGILVSFNQEEDEEKAKINK